MQEKTVLIVNKLENHFGVPKWQGRGKPLESLVKTILSQNTNDRNRDMAYEALKMKFPTWEDVMNAKALDIAAVIRSAGLANQKSINIKNVLLWIHQNYGSLDLEFLCDMDTDEAIATFLPLKGIGIKTISVVLMFACGKDIFPVDTHVHRLCGRLGLVPDKASAEKTHHLMQPLVPKGKSYSFHMNLLKLGRTICKARTPLCDICPLKNICPSSSPQVEKSK